jgi:hypothetical protein
LRILINYLLFKQTPVFISLVLYFNTYPELWQDLQSEKFELQWTPF